MRKALIASLLFAAIAAFPTGVANAQDEGPEAPAAAKLKQTAQPQFEVHYTVTAVSVSNPAFVIKVAEVKTVAPAEPVQLSLVKPYAFTYKAPFINTSGWKHRCSRNC